MVVICGGLQGTRPLSAFNVLSTKRHAGRRKTSARRHIKDRPQRVARSLPNEKGALSTSTFPYVRKKKAIKHILYENGRYATALLTPAAPEEDNISNRQND